MLCKCGCKKTPKLRQSKYLQGHNPQIETAEKILVKCHFCKKKFITFKGLSRRRFLCSKKCRSFFKSFFAKKIGLGGSKKGEKSQRWRGGICHSKGYIFIYKPKHPYASGIGYVREHRLVMEKHIGRYLKPEEVVHHKNSVKDDNRIENLELLHRRDHNRLHAYEEGPRKGWFKKGVKK